VSLLGRLAGASLALALSVPVAVAAGKLLTGPILSATGSRAFLAGFGLAVMATPFIKRLDFVNNFAHELGHMAMAVVTGGTVAEFVATNASGGHVRHRGTGTFSLPITIAPYCVPLLAFAVAAVSLLRGPSPALGFAILMGLAAGYHAVLAVLDLGANFAYGITGTDLERFGPACTLAWIWLVNVAAFGSLLAYAADGLSGLSVFWVVSWHEAVQLSLLVAGRGTT